MFLFSSLFSNTFFCHFNGHLLEILLLPNLSSASTCSSLRFSTVRPLATPGSYWATCILFIDLLIKKLCNTLTKAITKRFFEKYLNSSVSDNAPKYLVGCVIKKRYLPAQLLQFPAHDPLQQPHPLHLGGEVLPPTIAIWGKTPIWGIGSVLTTEMVTNSRRAQICR